MYVVWLRPDSLPRLMSGLICAILYNPPDTLLPDQTNLVEHIVDRLLWTPSRDEHVLDLIVSNLNIPYNKRTVIALSGTSDHNAVKLPPSASGPVRSHGKNTIKKCTMLPQSACDVFGRWCNSYTWFTDVKNPKSCSELASFSQDLCSAIDRTSPSKWSRFTVLQIYFGWHLR